MPVFRVIPAGDLLLTDPVIVQPDVIQRGFLGAISIIGFTSLVDANARFVYSMVGGYVTFSGADTSDNNGIFPIIDVFDAQTLIFQNWDAVADANNGSIRWSISATQPAMSKRRVALISGPAYVRQKIQTRLKFFEKEWFIDMRLGVPYYTEVYVQNPNLDRISTLFKKVILSIQEVSSIEKLLLTFDSKSRSLAVEFDCSLVSGGVLTVRQPDPPFIITIPRAA